MNAMMALMTTTVTIMGRLSP
jgi:hypothetical protein